MQSKLRPCTTAVPYAGSPAQLALTIHAFRGAFSRAPRWATSSPTLANTGDGDSGCNSSVRFCSADVRSGPGWESMAAHSRDCLQRNWVQEAHRPPQPFRASVSRCAPATIKPHSTNYFASRFATALGNARWRRFESAPDARSRLCAGLPKQSTMDNGLDPCES